MLLTSIDLSLVNFKGRFYCYADDLCFEHSGTDVNVIEQAVNDDLVNFEHYMNYWTRITWLWMSVRQNVWLSVTVTQV